MLLYTVDEKKPPFQYINENNVCRSQRSDLRIYDTGVYHGKYKDLSLIMTHRSRLQNTAHYTYTFVHRIP